MNDVDLSSHLLQLEAYHIKGNDFIPVPQMAPQYDFVSELLSNYLLDIKNRMKAGLLEKASSSIQLKKGVLLEDINKIVDECMTKSNDLLSNAEKLSLKMAEERKRKQIKKNIKKLAYKKL